MMKSLSRIPGHAAIALTLFAVLLCRVSSAKDLTWENVGYGGGGKFLLVEADPTNPERIFVGSDSAGLWITENAGKHFRYATGSWAAAHCRDIAVDPGNPDHLYLAAAGGVFRSKDGGWNWEHLGSFPFAATIEIAGFQNDEPVLYVGTGFTPENGTGIGEGKFHRYNYDGQKSWEVFTVPGLGSGSICDLVYDGSNHAHVWLSTSIGVFGSSDGGETWQAMNAGLPTTASTRGMIVDDADFSRKIVVEAQTGVYSWNEENGEWGAITGESFPRLSESTEYTAVVDYATKSGKPWGRALLVGSTDPAIGVVYTGDAGSTWELRNANLTSTVAGWVSRPENMVTTHTHSLTITAGEEIWAGGYGALYSSSGLTAPWYQWFQKTSRATANGLWENKGLVNAVIREITISRFDPDKRYICDAHNAFWQWETVPAAGWKQRIAQNEKINAEDAFFARVNPYHYVVKGRMLLVSVSEGRLNQSGKGSYWRYDPYASGHMHVRHTWDSLDAIDLAFCSDKRQAFWALRGEMTGLYRGNEHVYPMSKRRSIESNPETQRYLPTYTSMNFPSADIARIRAHPSNSKVLFLGIGGDSDSIGLWRGEENGYNWSYTHEISGDICRSIDFSPTNPDSVYATIGAKGLFCSPDGGETWTHMLAPGGAGAIHAVAVDQRLGTIYSASSTPMDLSEQVLDPANAPWIKYSKDGGASWTDFPYVPAPVAHQMTVHSDEENVELYMVSKGSGVWHASFTDGAVGVEDMITKDRGPSSRPRIMHGAAGVRRLVIPDETGLVAGVSLYSLNGSRIVESLPLERHDNRVESSMPDLSRGLYVARVRGGYSWSFRFTVK